jgi:hypothetical protein
MVLRKNYLWALVVVAGIALPHAAANYHANEHGNGEDGQGDAVVILGVVSGSSEHRLFVGDEV